VKIALLLLGLLTAHSSLTDAETHVELELLAEGLAVPWGMSFLSPGQLLITIRSGKAFILSLPSKKLLPLTGLPGVYAAGQGGLLDVAAHPDYPQQNWIYFTYTRKNQQQQAITVLARASLNGLQLHNWQELLASVSGTDTDRHFGSRIAFDNAGHIFFSIGDRGHRPNGQDLANHAGSVLRLQLDGSIPKDNPFLNQPQAQPEIWSYGHRNPQGLAYDTMTKRLWLIEHGPRGGDEINLIKAGKNYGWPIVSFGKEYWGPFHVGSPSNQVGMEPPIKQYTPSIAPGSLLFYSGKAFPQWRGNLFAGALKLQHLNRVVIDADNLQTREYRLLESLQERIRALIEDVEGNLIFSTDSGKVYRLKPAR
jgi:glucose/arabinose dehydrogenase